MKEIWKPIRNYNNYEVSNLGNVRNKEKILKLSLSTSGYYKIGLWKNGKMKNKYIHRIIIENFYNVLPKDKKTVIDHIDNNKLNNRIDNLQIVTNRYNSIKDKNSKSGYSCIYKNNKKWLVRVRINGKKTSLGTFENIEDAIKCRDNFFSTQLAEIIIKCQFWK